MFRDKVREIILREHSVLVEIIGQIICAACHAGAVYDSGGAVADVVVIVSIGGIIHLGASQLAAGVVPEGICHRGIVARGGAGERAAERIVGVAGGAAQGIRHADTASGNIRHGRGGVAAAIGVRQFHTRGGVAASGGGHDAVEVFLRNRKATDRHRFGGDVGCGAAAVPDTFRICIINTPLHGSQAAFVHRNDFAFEELV